MIEHKHSQFLRALADGVPLEEFECWHSDCGPRWAACEWVEVSPYINFIVNRPDEWQIRRKPKAHVVNGFTVPAPETEMPTEGTKYWIPDTNHPDWNWEFGWRSTTEANLWLDRGLIHLNKAAAVANAKAMCGIDPNAKEEA